MSLQTRLSALITAIGADVKAISGGVGAPNTQTADYTLVLADAGKAVEMNHSSSRTITIPTDASVNFPIGTVIELCRIGAGAVNIAVSAGVTMPNRIQVAGTTTRTLTAQYSTASIRKRAANTWVLAGDIS